MKSKAPSTPFRSRSEANPVFVELFRIFKKPGRLLDLGCNAGTDILYAAQHGWIAQGCDVDADAIAAANERFFRERTTNVSAFRLSIQECLAQTPYQYDLVMAVDVLTFLSRQDMPSVLAGIQRVVKPGGFVLLRVFTNLEQVVTHRPDRTFFETDELATAFAGWEMRCAKRARFQDPGHVGRPEPHVHDVEVFIAQKP